MRAALFHIVLLMLMSTLLTDAEAAMYSFVDQYGRLHFSNVPADPRFKEVPGYESLRHAAAPGRYGKFIRSAAERFRLDPELIKAIIKVESSFDPYAVSEKGAMGLMQLMPETAKEMKVGAPFEAEENIMGGSRYLRKLLDLFDGDLQLGLAAYNAGPTRVMASGTIPKISETQQYVEKVMREYGRGRINGMATQ